jgi:hypothetical protein
VQLLRPTCHWHRVLKSGCQIEALAHRNAERLQRAIAINLVIAWRIMLMTLLGRQCPDLPAELLFSDPEIEVLEAYAQKKDCLSPDSWVMPCVSLLASAVTWAEPPILPQDINSCGTAMRNSRLSAKAFVSTSEARDSQIYG